MSNYLKSIVLALVATGCSSSFSPPEDAGPMFSLDAGLAFPDETGGSIHPAETGGIFAGTGGALAETGGVLPTGGAAIPATGGAVLATGGIGPSTGGTLVETGGVPLTGGTEASGGAVATGGIIPCDDSDSDGICDSEDTCPSMPDDDADMNGYADACDQVLWRVEMDWDGFSPPASVTTALVELDNQFGENTTYPSAAYKSHGMPVSYDMDFVLSESVLPGDVSLRDNAGKFGVYFSPGNYAGQTAGWENYPYPLGTVTRHYYRAEYDATAHTIFAFWEIRGY